MLILKTLQVCEDTMRNNEKDASSPEAVYETMRFLEEEDRENFYVLHINAKNKIISRELVSLGTLTNSPVHPREVFKGAILSNAFSVILVHNHPSGDPTPSIDDLQITERLERVGVLVGIKVLDHVIVGHKKYHSIKLPPKKSKTAKKAKTDRKRKVPL